MNNFTFLSTGITQTMVGILLMIKKIEKEDLLSFRKERSP